MIFGRKPRKTKEGRKWTLAGEEIQETECYKYLGVELVGRLDFKKLKERYADAGVGNGDDRRGAAGHRLLHGVICACEACA